MGGRCCSNGWYCVSGLLVDTESVCFGGMVVALGWGVCCFEFWGFDCYACELVGFSLYACLVVGVGCVGGVIWFPVLLSFVGVGEFVLVVRWVVVGLSLGLLVSSYYVCLFVLVVWLLVITADYVVNSVGICYSVVL